MAWGKGNRITLGLQSSRGVEHRRPQRGQRRRQGYNTPLLTKKAISSLSSKAIYL